MQHHAFGDTAFGARAVGGEEVGDALRALTTAGNEGDVEGQGSIGMTWGPLQKQYGGLATAGRALRVDDIGERAYKSAGYDQC